MPIALLETKLYVPRSRRGLVLRPRLSERLDWGTAPKLVLVSAPGPGSAPGRCKSGGQRDGGKPRSMAEPWNG